MSDTLFIDLETVACTNAELQQMVREKVTHPKTIKKPESIEKWNKESRPQAEEAALKKTSFDGLMGEIVCIGFAVNDDPVETIYRDVGESESFMIKYFFAYLADNYGVNFNPQWCGHNIAGFDLPFLYQRCMIKNVKPTITLPRNPTVWSRDVFDTLFELTGKNMAGGSLDRISKLLGIGQKAEGFDGSMVNDAWHNGEIKKIAEYCRSDVNLTREIYKRILFIDKVKG